MNQKESLFIVVVDNEYLKDGDKRISEDSFGNEIPNLTIVKIIENGGFSYANNQGYVCQKYYKSRLYCCHEQ